MWPEELERRALAVFTDLLKIKSVNPPGNEKPAADYIIEALKPFGIEAEYIEKSPGRGNVVARLKGGRERPVILLSHIDVVAADEAKWRKPAFEAVTEDGCIWGRGALDTKHLTAMQIIAMTELAKAEKPLNRNVYFIASADEERGGGEGMAFLSQSHIDFAQNAYVVSEGGGFPVSVCGKDIMLYAAGEKASLRFILRANCAAGYADFIKALNALCSFRFPQTMTPISRKFFLESGANPDSDNISGDGAVDNIIRYMLRGSFHVTEIRTQTGAGPAGPLMSAELELKFLPPIAYEKALGLLKEITGGLDVECEILEFHPGYESSVNNELIDAFEANCGRFGFDGRLLPFYALGRTDGRFLAGRGADIYGLSPVLQSDSFTEILPRVHGNDERISIASFLFGTKVMAQTLRDLCV